MVSGLINANPVVYEKKERRARSASSCVNDEYAAEQIDQQEFLSLTFLHHVRDIKDPEHPYSLEELKVITEDAIEVDDERSYVRVTFTPTVEHCSMATVIGLCLRVKLMRSLPPRFKVDIMVAPGTHATEAAGKHTLPLHYVLSRSSKINDQE
ncbi:hypothetical protein CUMW_223690 [Citrus unshiu]|uniref:MIP18 family-like domain-containing protein n=1 Tax=Citrus unshiu TaxID=55188 RepID=A0A2H5QEZ2_CITUN|nr:hypothetical protein CUMW_223690 [Citrus unshiu]